MSSILTLRRPARLFTRIQSSEHEISSEPAHPPLQRFEDLPIWYQDNPSIRTGYRPVTHSTSGCISSWTFIHNETINIYTHLIAAILSIFAQFFLQSLISHHFPGAAFRDRLIFAANLVAATTTLSFSCGYHTLMNHSFPVSSIWLRIDYVGILALILGSFFSGIFVGFYCEHLLRRLYWSMIVTLSFITSIFVLHPQLQGLKYRSHRTMAFVATALSGFAPIGHGLYLYGWEEMWLRSGMPFWFLEGGVYGVGALFFASRFPESVWPGKFDIWGSSHQIFHVMIVIACVVHMMGVWNAYGWNYQNLQKCVADL